MRAVSRRCDLGPDDDPDRRRAAQGIDPVLQGRRARVLHRRRWSPLSTTPSSGSGRCWSAPSWSPGSDSGRGPDRPRSAIYLSEYAPPRKRRIVKPILEVLVGVPTIVFGYFALTFITPTILQDCSASTSRYSTHSPPVDHGLHDHADDRLDLRGRDVGRAQGLREGAYGLGATKRQVATRVVFPAAISGIVASIVLGDLARRRRDDDRPDRRGLKPNVEPQPAGAARDDHRLYGVDGEGRQPRRDDRL